MGNTAPLEERFSEHVEVLGLTRPGAHLLVALSGGCDSVSLLHLLRFPAAPLPVSLTAAHFDHAMRPGSAVDARWIAGLCRAWRVPLVSGRADAQLRSEDDARRARYAFLRRAARQVAADFILTAHHADDQAETVLFRVLRGTGTRGLAGIAPLTASGLARPLLPFWRREIERYAGRAGLRWRDDPTNHSLDPARNRIRHELLPAIEAHIAPGARRNLVTLAGLAREEERGWEEVLAPLEDAAVRREGDTLVLARNLLRDYDGAVGSRILRHLLRQFGIVPSRTGTRMALQFITDAESGRELHLPRGVRLSIEFDEARIERVRDIPPDEPLLLLPSASERNGQGVVRIGGRVYRVMWRIGRGAREPGEGRQAAFRAEELPFPLQIRGRRPGDRIRTAGGTKTLKKLFGEYRVPRSRRAQLPLLAGPDGSVLWVVGIARASELSPRRGEDVLSLTITDD